MPEPWGIVVKRINRRQKNAVSFSVHITNNPRKKEFFTHDAFHRRILIARRRRIGKGRKIGFADVVLDHKNKLCELFYFYPFNENKENPELEHQGAALFVRKKVIECLMGLHPDYRVKSIMLSHASDIALYLRSMKIDPHKEYTLQEYLAKLEAHEQKLGRKGL